MAFDARTLSRIARAEEVGILTRGARPVTIWAVLVGDQVYVRSVRGEKGGWFRRLVLEKAGELRIGRTTVPAKATLVKDDRTIAAVSLAFEQKYRDSGSLASMLRESTLLTTVRLDPA